jgi:GAF domain-containing protein
MPPSRSAREHESLRTVLESIGRETELAASLARVLEHACALLDADHGAIGLYDARRGVVRTAAIRDMPAVQLGEDVSARAGLVGQVLGTGKAVRVKRYTDLPLPTVPALADAAMIGVPVRWADALIGVFALGRMPRAAGTGAPRRSTFTVRDVAMLEQFARHAAIAVHNARRLDLERRRSERLAVIARVG